MKRKAASWPIFDFGPMKTLLALMLPVALLATGCGSQPGPLRRNYFEKYYIEGALMKQPSKEKKVSWLVLDPPSGSSIGPLPLEDNVVGVRERLKKEGWEFTQLDDASYILMVSFRTLEYRSNPKEFMLRAPLALEVRFDMVDREIYWSDTVANGKPTDTALAKSKIWVTILTAYSDHDHWSSILLNLMQKGAGEVGSYNAPGRVLGELVLPR